ncbi:MAG: UvrB/UvrC motif-containing protein [Tepidisphaerales bacterium]
MKCDNCNKPATVHLTEIRNGKKIEKHLCEQCAAQQEGVAVAKGHTPINELLTNFVMAHSGMQKELATSCEHCGISWAEFRQHGLFGCEHDYEVFEKDLTPLLKSAHEGATHHTGKSPVRAGGAPAAKPRKKMADLNRLKKELARAVETEDYERAATLRDQIRQTEEGPE